MAFAERFRQKWLPWIEILGNDPVDAAQVFHRRVDTYPTILIASKRASMKEPPVPVACHAGRTLQELGCAIKAGPALGHTPAFVLGPGEDDVEPELLLPWIHSSEILDGSIAWQRRRVVAMFAADGTLVDLRRYPRLERRLERYRSSLRAVSSSGGVRRGTGRSTEYEPLTGGVRSCSSPSLRGFPVSRSTVRVPCRHTGFTRSSRHETVSRICTRSCATAASHEHLTGSLPSSRGATLVVTSGFSRESASELDSFSWTACF